MSETHLSDIRFDSLGIAEPVLQGIQDAGFVSCTPIQAETLPVALSGGDVAGQAQTGTGKTAAFLVATFHHLLQVEPLPKRRPCDPRAVILAPTRELAVQIHKDAEALNRHCGFSLALAYGGTDYEKQRRKIEQGVDVLIGTPGRIIDYARQGVFSFGCAQVAILDEADRMFDLGFIKDIRFVLRRMPPPEQRVNHAVLRDAVAARAGTGLRAHERTKAGPYRSRTYDAGSHPTGHLLPVQPRKDTAADFAAAPHGPAGAR